MRCFLAIELPAAVTQRLAQLSAHLRQCPVRASWVRADHMHLTLRFLGDIDEGARDAVSADLGANLSSVGPIGLHVQGVGAFPNARRPSVVWAGIGPLTGPLETAHSRCETACQRAGLPAEPKPFHPHVTLARVKDQRPSAELTHAIERERAFTAGEFSARGVSLFSSELTPRGPVYPRIEEFPFT